MMGWAGTRPDPAAPATITDLIHSWDHPWALQLNNLEGKSEALAQAFIDGNGLAVCDGSYMPHSNSRFGTAAWLIQHANTQEGCRGVVQTSGDEREVNAYRSELQGLYTTLMAIMAICEFHNVTTGKVKVYCDNEKAIWLSDTKRLQVSLRTKHADLLRAIRRIRTTIPIDVDFHDIDGHQDKLKHFQDLDRPSQLNVLADTEAKRYLRHLLSYYEEPNCPKALFKEGWSCWLDDVKVTSDPGPAIRRFIHGRRMQEHCHIKEGLPREAFFLIDWDAIDDATASSPNLFNLWMTKQVSGFCAVGKMMKRWRFWENSKCHSCDEPKEDATHILYCPHDDRHKAWDEASHGFRGVDAGSEDRSRYPILLPHCTACPRPSHTFSCLRQLSRTSVGSRGARSHRLETLHERKGCTPMARYPG